MYTLYESQDFHPGPFLPLDCGHDDGEWWLLLWRIDHIQWVKNIDHYLHISLLWLSFSHPITITTHIVGTMHLKTFQRWITITITTHIIGNIRLQKTFQRWILTAAHCVSGEPNNPAKDMSVQQTHMISVFIWDYLKLALKVCKGGGPRHDRQGRCP